MVQGPVPNEFLARVKETGSSAHWENVEFSAKKFFKGAGGWVRGGEGKAVWRICGFFAKNFERMWK